MGAVELVQSGRVERRLRGGTVRRSAWRGAESRARGTHDKRHEPDSLCLQHGLVGQFVAEVEIVFCCRGRRVPVGLLEGRRRLVAVQEAHARLVQAEELGASDPRGACEEETEEKSTQADEVRPSPRPGRERGLSHPAARWKQ